MALPGTVVVEEYTSISGQISQKQNWKLCLKSEVISPHLRIKSSKFNWRKHSIKQGKENKKVHARQTRDDNVEENFFTLTGAENSEVCVRVSGSKTAH